MWKVYLSGFGIIFLLVLIIAFENISRQIGFLFLFDYGNYSLFTIVMMIFFLGVVSGFLLGLIPNALMGRRKDEDEESSDLDL